MTDLEELSAAAREALAPDQEVYLRPRLRRALEVLVPCIVAELARRREGCGYVTPERTGP